MLMLELLLLLLDVEAVDLLDSMLPHTWVQREYSAPAASATEDRFEDLRLRGIADDRPIVRRTCLEVIRGMFDLALLLQTNEELIGYPFDVLTLLIYGIVVVRRIHLSSRENEFAARCIAWQQPTVDIFTEHVAKTFPLQGKTTSCKGDAYRATPSWLFSRPIRMHNFSDTPENNLPDVITSRPRPKEGVIFLFTS